MPPKMTFIAFVMIALTVIYAIPTRANQATCAPRAQLIAFLSDRFKETQQIHAVDGKNRRIEIFSNTKNGSWTMIITDLNEFSCILAAGRGFELSEQA